ncbi:MAG: hypothetical protein HYU33_03500 [Candidatus Omnitrophica bacterium]|nr:hypothetical protein [Candidatus Omnitrophota bacterium]
MNGVGKRIKFTYSSLTRCFPTASLGDGIAVIAQFVEKRILLDANVLLTGLFVPQSKSRQILRAIQRRELPGYVIQNSIDEAETAISRAARGTGVNLLRAFREAMQISRLVVLPRVSRDESRAFAAINGTADKALAAAATKISAEICTNDLADFKNCDRYGFKTRTPQQLTDDGTVGLDSVVPGILATPYQGTFYVELTQLNWANVRFPTVATETLYLFDAERIGACYFEAKSHSFVVRLDDGPSLSVSHGVVRADSLPLKVVVTYDCMSEASIYIGTTEKESTALSWHPSGIAVDAKTWIACDRRGGNQVSGCVRLIYGVPYLVSERAARNMIAGVTVNDPWERLSVEDMITLLVRGTP